jgi:hypothetical protein
VAGEHLKTPWVSFHLDNRVDARPIKAEFEAARAGKQTDRA